MTPSNSPAPSSANRIVRASEPVRSGWRPLRSLRRAIAAWFVLVLVLTTTGFGATLCWYFQESLTDEADAELQAHATALTPAVMRLQLEERRRAFDRARGEARDRDRRDGDRRDREEGRRDERGREERPAGGAPAPGRPGDAARFNDGPPPDARRPDPPRPDVRRPDPPGDGEPPPPRPLSVSVIEEDAFRRARGAPYYVLWIGGRVAAHSENAPGAPFPTAMVAELERERLAAAGSVAASAPADGRERGIRERDATAGATPPPGGRGPWFTGNAAGRRIAVGPPDAQRGAPLWPPITRTYDKGSNRDLLVFFSRDEVFLISRSMEVEQARFQSFVGVVVAAGLGAVVFAAAGGWLLASLALRPIASMTHAAAEISERNLRNRLDVATAPSEMQDLAATINGAFDRLEDAFGRLRKFTADASHELRTPLAIASSHVQLALSRERSPEDYRKTLTTCRSALDRMGRLVESMLTLARLDAETARPAPGLCDVSKLAGEAVELLRPVADEHGAVIAGPDPAAPPVLARGDADRLLQVILNLAGNAIYYNRPDGRIDVTVAAEEGWGVLRVADQGEGIALEDQPRIFQRFFRADRSRSRRRGGAGLGLSIAKRIVEAHQGEISFDSRPGEGTTFIVRLPLAPTPVDAADSGAVTAVSASAADA